MRLYVHDYTVQYYKIANAKGENDIACTMSLYFSFDKVVNDNIYHRSFSFYAGTPMGIAKHICDRVEFKLIKAPISHRWFAPALIPSGLRGRVWWRCPAP